MIFHENCLLVDDSHVISYLIFVENWEKMSQNLPSAAAVIGALRVKASTYPFNVKLNRFDAISFFLWLYRFNGHPHKINFLGFVLWLNSVHRIHINESLLRQ